MERIQVLLDSEERDLFRRLARQQGLSLSGWLREAALTRAAEEQRVTPLSTIEELRKFWAASDARQAGREPDWEEHLAVLDASRRDGAGEVSAVTDDWRPDGDRPDARRATAARPGSRSPRRGRR
jgi:hypothetical protein